MNENDKIYALIKVVSNLNNLYQQKMKTSWHELLTIKKESVTKYELSRGQKVLRSFKKLDNNMYICNIYMKDDIYSFELINWKNKIDKYRI